MATELQFHDMLIAEQGDYALGVERTTGRHYISVSTSDGFVAEDEHFELSEAEFMALLDDPDGGEALARRCRAGEESGRLFGGPAGA